VVVVVGTHQTGIKKTRHTVRNVWWQKPTAHVYINCGRMHDMHACTAKNIWAITFYLQKKKDVLTVVL
jgi:phosphosulfolactate phosphohydrolase-like enzyme